MSRNSSDIELLKTAPEKSEQKFKKEYPEKLAQSHRKLADSV